IEMVGAISEESQRAPRSPHVSEGVSTLAKSRVSGDPARLRSTIEVIPDGVVITDSEGHIILVNHQTEVMFGYARAELVGQPVAVLMPERLRDAHREHLAAYAAAPRLVGAMRPQLGRRSDGSEFPVEVSLNPLPNEVAAGDREPSLAVLATIRDVSERVDRL